ncbi:MAG: glycerophosphodiester phosphodiesterase family protein [Negativicutes bacterium]|jgi:glycerophosphoryl diester phosphodiesterase
MIRLFVLTLLVTFLLTTTGLARPLVIAHRGGADLAPENTLAAFANSIFWGCDYFELDVHVSKDGQLVVMHDGDVSRTTNGKGEICDMTLAEIKQLDAGIKFNPLYAGERVPLLEQALNLAQGKCGVVIEIKYGGQKYPGIEQKVVDCIRAKNMIDKVLVISFDPESCKTVRQIEPKIRCGVLYGEALKIPAWQFAEQYNAEIASPNFNLATAAEINAAHAHGKLISVWTINKESDMKKYIALGVDAITTNNPPLLLKVLNGK